MSSKTQVAITVLGSREEIERLWRSPEYRSDYLDEAKAEVTFKDAPGDRGTEIHADLSGPRGGKIGEVAQKVTGSDPVAKAMDELRRFKQLVETGVIARSDGTPEGELAERKLKQRPAQPLEESEIEKAGV